MPIYGSKVILDGEYSPPFDPAESNIGEKLPTIFCPAQLTGVMVET